jgi:hypothetical protein
MTFTEENALKFHHYSASLTEAMRPILHTKKFDEINEEYWQKSLKEFVVIIQEILEPGIKVDFLEVNPEFIKEVHYKLFGTILNATIQTYGSLSIHNIIIEANTIAKKCIAELYGVKL